MTSFQQDQIAAVAAEERVRSRLRWCEDGAAKVSEWTVNTGWLQARRPLSEKEREVTVALNVMGELLGERARQAAEGREDRWGGLSDAATMVYNELGRRGLPQLSESIFATDEDLE